MNRRSASGAALTVRRNARRVKAEARHRGWGSVLASCAWWPVQWAAGRPGAGRPGRPFTFASREYRAHRHPYHYTWLNERAVEVPIFEALLDANPGAEVLEVGNVLSHYRPVEHTVVDKYESAPGILNHDVVDYAPGRSFDLILAISTLEHVGIDEDTREEDKAARAVERLVGLLRAGGQLVISAPVGYNAALEDALARHGFELRALRRQGGRWREVDPAAAAGARYDRLLLRAEVVLVASLRRNSS